VIRIGTRASALALVQAGWVASQTDGAKLVEITTAGDRGEDAGDKSRWTSALERALLDDQIDIAVHSAKDVPGQLAEGTEIVAIPERSDPRDVICGGTAITSLGSGARIGTSSIRRTAQIRAVRDDLEIVGLRGNVDTRLRKLAEGQVDALVLAAAGLKRLGRSDEAGVYLDELLSAPGQGALIIQARAEDAPTLSAVAHMNDRTAERCVMAERALASTLAATCTTPLGALAVPASGSDVTLRAWIGLPDGSRWIADEISAPAERVGELLAQRMITVGAGELLQRAEEMADS
jgi:hydroxymethylbilane synthase